MRMKSFCLIAGLALLSACGKSDESANTPTPASAKPSNLTLTPAQQARIHIDTVALSKFYPSVLTTGTVAFNGDRSTQVLSPVSGPVTKLLVQPGTVVSAGTALAIVSSPDFAAAVGAYRKAVVTATNLQRIADQDVQLFKTDALSRRDLEQAQADAASAVADREAALEQIRSLGIDPSVIESATNGGSTGAVPGVIRAPIAGTVVERLITPGQLLQAGATPAFTIADLSTVWVMANVFESDLATVHKGEHVTVTSAVSPTPFDGTVDYVGALVDSSTRATAVRLVVRNRNDLLKRDMYVNVAIRGDQQKSGILAPVDAVLRDDQNLPFVFVATGTSPNVQYARRSVTLGQRIGDDYEILSGLNPGDRVVAEGALFLQFAESL
ncbi:MAG TPA: efflux RND transporter periplasmic adaptor subunit [Gemmatimonadaceae bacterium]|nr:efflux RND transporter periplasmic adaptor subunit [Gemmatimonadaceae bacterium]